MLHALVHGGTGTWSRDLARAPYARALPACHAMPWPCQIMMHVG